MAGHNKSILLQELRKSESFLWLEISPPPINKEGGHFWPPSLRIVASCEAV